MVFVMGMNGICVTKLYFNSFGYNQVNVMVNVKVFPEDNS